MLNCRACLWRCTEVLGAATVASPSIRRNAAPTVVFRQQRSLQTSRGPIRKIGTRPTHLVGVEKLSRSQAEPWRNSNQAISLKKQERLALRRRGSKPSDGEGVTRQSLWMGKRDPTMSNQDWNNRMRELQYLKDPVELAAFVRKELAKDKVTEMLQLVRMASHSVQCVVSWNHIIDYYLVKERVSDALKVYNDMKKRAQFPDSYTYTILLRGLSINAHQSGVLSKALSIYHSLFAPNSRVEPSIIHTNAALRVCARTLDMDALWGIAAKIPESGPASANAITYITILNAMRQSVLVDVPKGETEEQTAARRERSILEGRRMWEDIVSKWRNADLVIDEDLVCAMGRLLLIGMRPRDWDDVLSLVEQTMDIPRLVPRLGTAARHEAGLPHLRAPNVPEQYRFDDDHLSPSKSPMRGDEFLSLSPQGRGGAVSNPLRYATPSNNTLSLVQEACQKVVANKAAQEYWDLLTDPTTYGIVPDLNNLHMRLRNLRLNRASATAVKVLKEDFIGRGIHPRTGTFRIAMSTCVRDKNNHNSLKHASEILHIMTKTLEDADPKAVTMYADLALAFPLAKGEDLINALTYLQPITKNIRIQLGVGGRTTSNNGVGATYLTGPEREDAISALRKIYGVYDRLLLSDMIPEEQKAPFKAERARLSSFIQRATFKDSRRKWDMAKEALEGDVDSVPKVPDGIREPEFKDTDRNGEGRKVQRVFSNKKKAWFPTSAEVAA